MRKNIQEIEPTRIFEEESGNFRPIRELILKSESAFDASLIREMIFAYFNQGNLLPDEHHELLVLLQNTQFAKLNQLIQSHPDLGIKFWKQKISEEKKAQVISTTQYRMLLELISTISQ